MQRVPANFLGSSICPRKRQQSRCAWQEQALGLEGSQICEHDRIRSQCNAGKVTRGVTRSQRKEYLGSSGESAPTSARTAGARNTVDCRYASITASGGRARSVWGRASAPTRASRAGARTVAAVPSTRLAWMQAGVHQARSRAREWGAGNPTKVARQLCHKRQNQSLPTLPFMPHRPLMTSKMTLTMGRSTADVIVSCEGTEDVTFALI